jgi:hypothetical protein
MELPVFHLIGDLHWAVNDQGLSPVRLAALEADMPNLPGVTAHLHVGDGTQDSLPAEDAGFQAWMTALPHQAISAIGNHDTYDRSGDAAAAAMGLPGKNQSHNLGGCQVIVLGPDEHINSNIVLTQATLDYLDAELAACSPRPGIVIAHASLYSTVVGVGELESTVNPWFVVGLDIANATNGVRDQAIRDVLAAHDNARAWIGGHSHNPISNPSLWTTIELGGKHVIAGNASALPWTQPPAGPTTQEWLDRYTSKLCSAIVYVLGDRMEIRYRDHYRRRATTGPDGQRLTIIYYDDGLVVHERRAA